MYAKVDKDRYQKVTGHTRASLLAGRFLAAVLAQLLYSYNFLDIRELNYISLGSQAVSLAVAVCLPSVGISIYMWSYDDDRPNDSSTIQAESIHKISSLKPKFSWSRARTLLWQHFLQAYSDSTVLIWSIWWSLAMAGFLQIQSYVQLLWLDIDPHQENFYNGAVEAAVTLMGATACLVAGFVPSDKFEKFDLWILTICSLVEGIMIVISSYTSSIWIAYIMYVLFGTIYMFMVSILMHQK